MRTKIYLLLLFVANTVFSQRYEIIEGDLENLKGIQLFSTEFNYDKLQVYGFKSEEAFLKEKLEKRKDNPEKAEEFKRNWFENREKYYNPAFVAYFNDLFKNQECKITSEASHLMKVNLTWIYPGYALEPAKLSATIDFYKREDPSKKILSIHFDKVIGFERKTIAVNEYERIIGAFEKLARNLAIQMKRVL